MTPFELEDERPMIDPIADGLEAMIVKWEPAGHQAPIAELLRSFRFRHLPAHLQDVSRPFAGLASRVAERLGNDTKGYADTRNYGRLYQGTVALQRLHEAKNAAVLAVLP